MLFIYHPRNRHNETATLSFLPSDHETNHWVTDAAVMPFPSNQRCGLTGLNLPIRTATESWG